MKNKSNFLLILVFFISIFSFGYLEPANPMKNLIKRIEEFCLRNKKKTLVEVIKVDKVLEDLKEVEYLEIEVEEDLEEIEEEIKKQFFNPRFDLQKDWSEIASFFSPSYYRSFLLEAVDKYLKISLTGCCKDGNSDSSEDYSLKEFFLDYKMVHKNILFRKIKFLMYRIVSLNFRFNNGDTLLHRIVYSCSRYSIKNGLKHVIDLFIEYDLDLYVKNSNGHTVADIARNRGFEEIEALIKEKRRGKMGCLGFLKTFFV